MNERDDEVVTIHELAEDYLKFAYDPVPDKGTSEYLQVYGDFLCGAMAAIRLMKHGGNIGVLDAETRTLAAQIAEQQNNDQTSLNE